MHAVFPDNTVLCNFAAVRRLDLLEAVLRGRGRWTDAVAFEAGRSARVHPDLAGLPSAGWLGEPIEIDDPDDVDRVERLRRSVFGGTSADALRHLGEAQTLYLIEHRAEFAGAWWVSDDLEAQRYGRRQRLVVRDTCDLVREAVAMGDVTDRDGYSLLQRMLAAGRFVRVSRSAADLRT